MLQMMLKTVGLILVYFSSRKVQSKKHVEDTEEDIEECWFNIGLLLVQESTKCLAYLLQLYLLVSMVFNSLFFHYSLFTFFIYIFSSFLPT